MLDSRYDDPTAARGNSATRQYVNDIAAAEGLDLECRLGNPTGTGLHAKVVLVTAAGETWSHVGSINGSEASSKENREAALQVDSADVHARLSAVFDEDWVTGS